MLHDSGVPKDQLVYGLWKIKTIRIKISIQENLLGLWWHIPQKNERRKSVSQCETILCLWFSLVLFETPHFPIPKNSDPSIHHLNINPPTVYSLSSRDSFACLRKQLGHLPCHTKNLMGMVMA